MWKDILVFLIICFVFFVYGFLLSQAIDHFFPEHGPNKHDKWIIIETGIELLIAYIFYFILDKYSNIFVSHMYQFFHRTEPTFIKPILLLAFSSGLYRNLTKSNEKIDYFKMKYLSL